MDSSLVRAVIRPAFIVKLHALTGVASYLRYNMFVIESKDQAASFRVWSVASISR